jgi:hypothetical protein
MGRPSKIPFKITPVISRYLRDIQFGKEDVDDPSITSGSGDWFLISTWENKEAYSTEGEDNLESMKSFLSKEKIAHFPTFQEYEERFDIKFSDEATLGYLHDPDTNERFVFEKSFPVEVLDLEALKRFRKTYCLNEKDDKDSTRYESLRKLKFENGTLSYLGKKSYTITDPKAQRIFEHLWTGHEHYIKGQKEPHKAGESKTLIKFMISAELTGTTEASQDVMKTAQKAIRGVVGNAFRHIKGKNLIIKLNAKPQKVLLTVKEK